MSSFDHKADEARVFFDQWHVYDQVIRHDYMAHRGIHDALRHTLAATREIPFTVLDLGCGDATHVVQTLKDLPLRAYIGVDVSPVALEKARANFTATFGEMEDLTLIEADFTEALADPHAPQADVIVAGFSVHHLRRHEKNAFFQSCLARLNPSGDLFLYDIFCRPGESRDQFLEAYIHNFKQNWTELSTDSLSRIEEHVRACDFPETQADLAAMAEAAGFTVSPEPVYADSDRFHSLYRFSGKVRSRSRITAAW